MSKFIVALVLLVLAVCVSGSPPAQIKGAVKHINSLISKIKTERRQGGILHAQHVKKCRTELSAHRLANTQLRASTARQHRSIARESGQIRNFRSAIGADQHQIRVLKKKAALQAKQIAQADKDRVKTHKKFTAKVHEMEGHVKFVRELFTFIMGSTVERRRNVMIEMANKVSARAASLRGSSAALMEMTAHAMVSGHLDHIYRLLDKLRAKIQSNHRQAVRNEQNSTREWVRRSSRRRDAENRTWRQINRKDKDIANLKTRIARADQIIAKSHMTAESNSIKLAHHTRDARILAMRCKRWAAQYKEDVKGWASELKTLGIVLQKIRAHKFD